MARARSYCIAVALMALAPAAMADAGSFGLPSPSFPALAAAPLVYVIVPDPLGGATWSEREWEAVLLGAGRRAREEGSFATGSVLLSLHSERATSAFALEMTDLPPDRTLRRAPQAISTDRADAPEDARLVGALEALGLDPEDLVEKREMPAFALADAIASVDRAVFGERAVAHEPISRAASLRVDPEERYVREPSQSKHRMSPRAGPNRNTPTMIFAKRVARSIYKILLGVAIGVLIWGFVRNT